MLLRRHPREWGPVDWAVAFALTVLLAALVAFGWRELSGPGRCGDELTEVDGDCVGVTEYAFDADPALDGLVKDIAAENARVREGAEREDSEARIPYVRIALMMPFTSDDSSAMTTDMIRRALAGALAAQQEANSSYGPHYQLLFAPDGRDMTQWKPVVDRLAELAGDSRAPLVGVTGIPSSTDATSDAIDELNKRELPTIGPVITAADMNAPYFFKTSPNNDEFARALKRYLDKRPERRKGFLVWDNRTEDVYSRNLKEVYEKHFGDTYELADRNSNFTGSSGRDQGIPNRFTDAAEKICRYKSDTVFFAGRDQDLPSFVKRLAQEGDCGRSTTLRILKVGIGIEPTLTAKEPTRRLQEIDATIVNASSVDPDWWSGRSSPDRPAALDRFLARYEKLVDQHDLGDKELDDGYTLMYHDAFTLLSDAVDRTYSEINEDGQGTTAARDLPMSGDIYNTLRLPTISAGQCDNCLIGAAGTYGFEGPEQNQQWSVCKPVPIVEHPTVRREPDDVLPLYRTFRGDAENACRT
ncbi:ABC transporter substrate-binding protein [Streptomyces boluensis]|uniref:Uncharacterized protein n=1 Tax=Streptomyces boluensis TaxID=1775135 RepID=A0A964UUQ3_9ACTN|nr:ABC transporter substrate-binding protein [Streptomyces boluensis]NBE54725.1 hypothetical protein [Streptomyces boluensis]